jgi:hypothetical protein
MSSKPSIPVTLRLPGVIDFESEGSVNSSPVEGLPPAPLEHAVNTTAQTDSKVATYLTWPANAHGHS